MRPRTPPVRLGLAGVLLSLAVVLLAPLPQGTAAGPAATGQAVTLKLTAISPASGLDRDHDLVVTGTLRNPGTAINDATLRLRLGGTILRTRERVESWITDGTIDGATAGPGRPLPGGRKLAQIRAGTTVQFTLVVPAGRMGLSSLSSAFGPRGLIIDLSSGSTRVATLRTTIVWAPRAPEQKTSLSLLVPITSAVPSDDAGAASQANADLLVRGGRLQRVLDASSDPAFDWAIDPAVLQAAARLSATGVQPGADGEPTGNPGTTGSASSTGSAAAPSGSAPSGSAATGGPASAGSGSAVSGSAGSGSAGSGSGSPAATGSDAGTGAPGTAGAGSSDARAWLAAVKQGRDDRVVLGLPYADPDLNSVLDNGQPGLLRTADQLGKQVSHDVLGGRLDRTVAWPGDGKVSSQAIAGLNRAKRTDVLLASSIQPPADDLTYTPTGRSVMQAKDRRLNGLLYDEQLSAQLAASGGASAVASAQTMLATLAAIGMEHPGGTVHVLAVTPRTWSPDPAKVSALTSALRLANWVTLSDLDTLRAQSPNATQRDQPVYSQASREQELPVGQITSIARFNDGLNLFAPIAVNPEPGLSQLRERITSLLSTSWRTRSEELSSARLRVSKIVNPVTGGVRLLGSRSRIFTAKQSSLGMTVQNETAFAVQVRVKLTPQTGQLSTAGSTSVRVEAGERKTVQIATRALANGDVDVQARMLTPAGLQLGPTSSFRVRVRTNWETWGLIGAASVLGVLLVVGLLRSVRRDRTRVPVESVPDVDDIAASHEPRTTPAPPPAPAIAGRQKQ